MGRRPAVAFAIVGVMLGGVSASAQGRGGMGMGRGMMAMGHDSATTAQMRVIHELVVNNARINRTVTNLPDGIRTTTTSDDPRLATLIKAHVQTMDQRVQGGDDPGLPMESPALHAIFLGNDRVRTTTDTTPTGVTVTQTSNDSTIVAALQQHAAEVTALVERGMAAMHDAMMKNMSGGMMTMMPEMPADSGFSAMQERGKQAMGVDQYTSTHHFDARADGGRIELQRDVEDTAGVSAIRRHLKELAAAFAAGNFSTPGFVHMQEVPGTKVMAAKRDVIAYTYRDLPRGGEVRMVATDPDAVAAIHEFLAFQRREHTMH